MTPAGQARAAVGLACLLAPSAVPTLIGAPDAQDLRLRVTARVLGTRYLLQAAAGRAPLVRHLGPGVELAHAVSMLPVAVRSRRHRRSAVASATVAAAIAAIDATT